MLSQRTRRRRFSFCGEKESPKVALEGVYSSETNLEEYDRYIRFRLDEDDNIDRSARIKVIEGKLKQRLRRVEKRTLLTEKAKLEKDIEAAKNNKIEYSSKMAPILERFRRARGKSSETRDVVRDFQAIARDFCPDLNLRGEKIAQDKCYFCHNDLEFNEQRDIASCDQCGEIISVGDLELRDSPTKRNAYESTDNFIKTLDAYRGKVKAAPGHKFYEELGEYCNERNIDPPSLTPSDIRDILKEKGKCKLYPAAHLILHVFAGRPLPDLEDIREDLIEDNRIFDREFDKIKDSKRNSSINTQKKLYVLLRKNGYKCSPDEFKIPRTAEIELRHNTFIIRIFERLGWDYSFL